MKTGFKDCIDIVFWSGKAVEYLSSIRITKKQPIEDVSILDRLDDILTPVKNTSRKISVNTQIEGQGRQIFSTVGFMAEIEDRKRDCIERITKLLRKLEG